MRTPFCCFCEMFKKYDTLLSESSFVCSACPPTNHLYTCIWLSLFLYSNCSWPVHISFFIFSNFSSVKGMFPEGDFGLSAMRVPRIQSAPCAQTISDQLCSLPLECVPLLTPALSSDGFTESFCIFGYFRILRYQRHPSVLLSFSLMDTENAWIL